MMTHESESTARRSDRALRNGDAVEREGVRYTVLATVGAKAWVKDAAGRSHVFLISELETNT